MDAREEAVTPATADRLESAPASRMTSAVNASFDTHRIHVAALVAQQSALFDRELRLQEREAALARQEEQLAGHLEDKRRQLLELQDQITEAREDLRQKRTTQEALAAEQAEELASARDEAARLMVGAKSQRRRLTQLQQRLRDRWRRERKSLDAIQTKIEADRQRLHGEREVAAESLARRTAQIELEKRQTQAAWDRLRTERKAWTEKRSAELTSWRQRLSDVARREKAIRAAEKSQQAERDRLAKEFSDRRHEIERLETRIGHTRQRLLDAQAGLIVLPTKSEPPAQIAVAPVPSSQPADDRAAPLAQIAIDLADQRLWLTEQTARLIRARSQWIAERDAAVAEMQSIAGTLQDRESALSRRVKELDAAEKQTREQIEAVTAQRLQLEAERTQREAAWALARRDFEQRLEKLAANERTIARRENQINDVLKTWGRRRRLAIEELRAAAEAARTERDEWKAARISWLRESEQAIAERRDLAVRAVALEHARQEWLGEADKSMLAAKRIERFERQWVVQFTADVRELDRMRAALEAEALRLDESAEQIRRDRMAAADELLSADERLAELDAARAQVNGERLRIVAESDDERSRRLAVESQVEELRGEVEGLARLFIDTAPTVTRAA